MPRERPNCKKLRKFVEFRLDNWGLVASGGGPPRFYLKNGTARECESFIQYLDISGKFLKQSAMNLSCDANR